MDLAGKRGEIIRHLEDALAIAGTAAICARNVC